MSALIFLLSPASLGGIRGRALLGGRSSAPFSDALRLGSAVPLGEIYTFISSLYFRGKRTYALRFARPPVGNAGVWVVTPTRGLVREDTPVTRSDLQELAGGAIEPNEPRYLRALGLTASRLKEEVGPDCGVVLLGSIASARYLEPLVKVFGERLAVPETFAGRGDMSRGGLLLRCVEAGEELVYVPALAAVRRGTRPPKLERRH